MTLTDGGRAGRFMCPYWTKPEYPLRERETAAGGIMIGAATVGAVLTVYRVWVISG